MARQCYRTAGTSSSDHVLEPYSADTHLFAGRPTSTSPSAPKDTTEGVVRPSAVEMMRGTPCSTTCSNVILFHRKFDRRDGNSDVSFATCMHTPMCRHAKWRTATAEFVVPRSMPTLRFASAADNRITCRKAQNGSIPTKCREAGRVDFRKVAAPMRRSGDGGVACRPSRQRSAGVSAVGNATALPQIIGK